MVDVLAMPVVVGRKTTRERFAGATDTLTCEAMMGDGKALQMGTSHELGQNFSRPFGIEFVDASRERQFAWQTSWGSSTRMVGGLVMAHGDDAGLRVPPRLAPIQVVVLAVKPEAVEAAERIAADADLRAAGSRVELDARTDTPFGRRAVDWELRGVPVRVEVGPRDLADQRATLVRRVPGTKEPVGLAALPDLVRVALVEDQVDLLARAQRRRDARTTDAKTVDEVVEAAATGWARIPWANLGADGEQALVQRSVTVRCLVRPDGGVPDAEDEPELLAYCARAY